MINSYQLSGNGQLALGFGPLPQVGPARPFIMVHTLMYATVGAALGTLVGVTLAATPWRANAPSPQVDFAQVSATVAPAKSYPLASAGGAAHLQSQTVSQPTVHRSSAPAPPVVKTTPVRATSPAHRRHVSRGISAIGRSSSSPAPLYSYNPHIVTNPPPAAPAAQAATPSNEPAPLILAIEGDLTLVNYDASAGTIETQEGKTFLIGATVSESAAQRWQDSQGNVHFRCDLSGNCTLFHAGVVVHNARMTI